MFDFFYEYLSQNMEKMAEAEVESHAGIEKEAIFGNLKTELLKWYSDVSLRTLIWDMHRQKVAGNLKGQDSREEFVYYEEKILGQKGYPEKLLQQYPALKAMIFRYTKNATRYRLEVYDKWRRDRAELEKRFGIEKGQEIRQISGSHSDSHNGNRTVLVITLKNGQKLVYKPKSASNESFWNDILQWCACGAGICQYPYRVWDRGGAKRTEETIEKTDIGAWGKEEYSWAEWLEEAFCSSEAEVKDFYRRMGVVLFAAYLLSMNDLHQENLVAHGAWPVVVDAETILGVRGERKPEGAEEIAREVLRNSVLASGLLPFCFWTEDGKGVVLSALGKEKEQKSWVKMPVVAESGTSEMHIEYRYAQIAGGRNLPVFQGRRVGAEEYESEILNGFVRAYTFAMEHKEELNEKVRKGKGVYSRVLLRHTQQYLMYLGSSYHPEVLKKENGRQELFEYGLSCRSRIRLPEAIRNVEVQNLIQGDIPVFYANDFDRAIYDEKKQRIMDYYAQSGNEILRQKIERLDKADRERQMDWIRISMELLKEQEGEEKSAAFVEEQLFRKDQAEEMICSLYRKLERGAIWDSEKAGITWLHVKVDPWREAAWNIRPAGMYLYDGLAGIALFVIAAEKYGYGSESPWLGRAVKQALFAYTDQCLADGSAVESSYTGVFVGEGSILYAYSVLYRMTGETEWLAYAEKHSDILEKQIDRDEQWDLLSGNAGAILAFLNLYEGTGKTCYVRLAERAAGRLKEAWQKTERGIGWVLPGQHQVLSGLSHGESGFALAFCRLYQATGKAEYREIAEQILYYEDGLYEESYENWPDLRGRKDGETGADMTAWCNGATGIWLARRQMRELKRAERDREKAEKKVKESWNLSSGWCLCHGKLGNAVVLGEALKKKEWEQLFAQCIYAWESGKGMKVIERENLGFMTGIVGVAYTLLNYLQGKLLAQILEVR